MAQQSPLQYLQRVETLELERMAMVVEVAVDKALLDVCGTSHTEK